MDWKKNFRVLKKVRSLQELGDYWRLVWELGACAPVPYLADNALPDRLIVDDNQRLEAYNFKVFIDGIPLVRPVFLRGNEGGYTTHKIEPVELRPCERPSPPGSGS
jgi:hypothetical protein